MSKSAHLLMIYTLIILINTITLSFPTVEASSGDNLSWIPATTSTGSITDWIAGDLDFDDNEFSMDSETNRRILAARRRYISYGALSKNNVPCSRRGASYYNCRSGGQANPYSRGCSAITRCRR